MSYNRLIYDNCAYKQRINESVAPLFYHLNDIAYQNKANPINMLVAINCAIKMSNNSYY